MASPEAGELTRFTPERYANGGRRRAGWLAATVVACLALTACGGDSEPPAENADTQTQAQAGSTTPAGEPSEAPMTVPPQEAPAEPPEVELADPVSVAVPSLEIEASMSPLSVDGNNVLIPPEYGEAGWWQAGPEPGEPGAAVIAGHLDNADGPDVFFRLADAQVGDQVIVTLADGGEAEFQVVEVGQYSQDDFPTDLVYRGPDDQPLLRLITCGGEYDRELGRYRDNVVVFAEPV